MIGCFSPIAYAGWGEPPETPSGLNVPTSDADGTYTVSWNPSPTTDYYELQEKIGAGSWSTVYSSSQTTVIFSKAVIETYTYRVKACSNPNGCSSYSSTDAVDVTGGIESPSGEEENTAYLDIGTIPYSLNVATDGDSVISVPLQLIPGVAGFGPSLSFEYDSGRGVDLLEQSLPYDTIGYGWRLAGLSQIRRCVVNQASSASIDLDSGDSLCFNGIPLVLASGTEFTVGAIYRTLFESYIKFEIKGSAGSLWFEVTLPDGTVQEYGNGRGSRVDKSGSVDYQWSLSKEIDTYNNEIDYTYWFDPSNGVNRILSIDYADAQVEFEYLERAEEMSVTIDSLNQTQDLFLHTVRVNFDGDSVREYRLIEGEVDLNPQGVGDDRTRLEKIQLCGYDTNGSFEKCLKPLKLEWLEFALESPAKPTMAGVDMVVFGIEDGLGANHKFEYATITNTAHPAEFTEEPFGAEPSTLPSEIQYVSGTGARRHVVETLRRDDGLPDSNPLDLDDDFHVTSYAYQNEGIESTKHWGFLGFFAQRIKDEQSGIVTYAQYRMDYPYFGEIAQLHQYEGVFGSEDQILTRSEFEYSQESVSHGSNETVYPYQSTAVDFLYEDDSKLGASKTINDLTFSNGYISALAATTQTVTGMANGSQGSIWGDVSTATPTGFLNTKKLSVSLANRSTSGDWLIGFPSTIDNESWDGDEGTAGEGIVQDATLVYKVGHMSVGSIVKFPNDTSLKTTTGISYDSAGRAYSVSVSGLDVTTRITNIASFTEGRYPYQIANPKNQTTTHSVYDLRFGTPSTTGDINGRNTTTVRDAFGRVTSMTNADGVVTTNTFTECDSNECPNPPYGVAPAYKVSTTQARSSVTVSPEQVAYYDKLGRIVRTEYESFAGSTYVKQDTEFDTQGRVATYSLPYIGTASNDIELEYDIRDRVKKITRPDSGATNDDSTTEYVYTADTQDNRIIEQVTEVVLDSDENDDVSQVKRNEYNILGQLVETVDGFGSSINPSTTYTYDSNGNMLTASVSDGTTTTTTEIEYDAAGNPEEITGPNFGTVTKTYYPTGELKTVTDEMGQVSTYEWDVLGRLEELELDDGTNSTTSEWIWDTATNGAGKLKSRSSPGFTETYSYYSDSRLKNVVTNITPIGGSTGTDYTTSFAFDTEGRLEETSYPGGFELTREYNARGYLSKLKDGTSAIQTFNTMDAFGNSTKETYANGVTTERTFDEYTGRIDTVLTKKGSSKTFQDNIYSWRSNGTLESRKNKPAEGLTTTREEKYTYDILNRLDSAATHINGSGTASRILDYSYNELGNLTENDSDVDGDFDVDDFDYGGVSVGPHAAVSFRVDQDNDGTPGVLYELTYNDNGAVTKYDIDGTSDDKYIAYNMHNQPTKIVVGESLTDSTPEAIDEFAYGPNGQRFARKTSWKDGGNTYVEEVVYIGVVEIITDDSSGSTLTTTKTPISNNVMYVEIFDGTNTETFFEYAHRDHLGSIEVVTDENGDELDNLALDNFGSRKNANWSSDISALELADLLEVDTGRSRKVRGFTGHEHLDRTGFVHMNGRVYDPLIGRFLSPDPVVQSPDFSQSWNRYSYTLNVPTSLTDPSGFISQWDNPCSDACAGSAWLDGHEAGLDAWRALNNFLDNRTLAFPERFDRHPSSSVEISQSKDGTSSPDSSAWDFLDQIPANPKKIFDDALKASKDNPFTRSRAVVSFHDKIAIGQCDGSKGCQKASIKGYFDTVDEAKKFLEKNPDSVVINGVYSDEIIIIFRTATVPHKYYYMDSQSLAKSRITGRIPSTQLSSIESVVKVLAHEAGHHFGLGHGDEMLIREKGAIRYHRKSTEQEK